MNVIGKSHQVICITHLPQIAAMADSHYLIAKEVVGQNTISFRPSAYGGRERYRAGKNAWRCENNGYGTGKRERNENIGTKC